MRFLSFLLILVISSCSGKNSELNYNTNTGYNTTKIIIQPFEGIDINDINFLKTQLKRWYKIEVEILDKGSLPAQAWYSPRSRYIADTILTFLNSISRSKNEYLLGVTGKDISIHKSEGINWGIMGYGFQPGNACVVSTYRLKNGISTRRHLQERLLKVALHEIGHNFGLAHCPVQSCFLVDAEGRDKLESEVEFCKNCKNYLVKKGFQ